MASGVLSNKLALVYLDPESSTKMEDESSTGVVTQSGHRGRRVELLTHGHVFLELTEVQLYTQTHTHTLDSYLKSRFKGTGARMYRRAHTHTHTGARTLTHWEVRETVSVEGLIRVTLMDIFFFLPF